MKCLNTKKFSSLMKKFSATVFIELRDLPKWVI